jgi:hypothetical protein
MLSDRLSVGPAQQDICMARLVDRVTAGLRELGTLHGKVLFQGRDPGIADTVYDSLLMFVRL